MWHYVLLRGVLLISSVFLVFQVSAAPSCGNGLIIMRSHHSVAETVQRAEAAIKSNSMTLMAHIDYAAAAKQAGVDMADNVLLLFGNPRQHAELLKSQASMAVELPLRIAVWSDDKKQVWLAYNDPGVIAARQYVNGQQDLLKDMRMTLDRIVNQSIAK